MPALETPPNPAPPTPPPVAPKVPAGRFGELDHHELIHLLDALDDDRARSRFRESVYVSLLFYIVVAWFVLYGPRVLWHTPQVVPIKMDDAQDKHQLTYLETPRNLARLLPKPTPKAAPDRRAISPPEPARPAPPQPAPPVKPVPTPNPQPAARQQQAPPQPSQPPLQPPLQARVQPPAPQPRPQPSAAIPEAPRPQPSARPSFSSPPTTAGEAIAQAAREAAAHRGGGDDGLTSPLAHPGLQSGTEILTDTQGVDFRSWSNRFHSIVQSAWDPLIPEETRPPLSKEGTTQILITIRKDGTLTAMSLEDSTHDIAIDHAAWGALKSTLQYPPLPAAFTGPEIQLRCTFVIQTRRSPAQ